MKKTIKKKSPIIKPVREFFEGDFIVTNTMFFPPLEKTAPPPASGIIISTREGLHGTEYLCRFRDGTEWCSDYAGRFRTKCARWMSSFEIDLDF